MASGNHSPKLQRNDSGDLRRDPPNDSNQTSRERALPLFQNTVTLVAYIREARRLRNEFFDPNVFGEPGWDILLDLYRAELAQQRLAISSIGLSSGIPPTTTIRWLNTLESKGLIRREPDPLDARRIFASLTGEAVRVLDAMFAALSHKAAALQFSKVSDTSLAVS